MLGNTDQRNQLSQEVSRHQVGLRVLPHRKGTGMLQGNPHEMVPAVHNGTDLFHQLFPTLGTAGIQDHCAAHSLQTVEGHLIRQLFHQICGNILDQMVAVCTAPGAVDLRDAVEAESNRQRGALLPLHLVQIAQQSLFPWEVGDRVNDKRIILMAHTAREEQRQGLILVPFEDTIAPHPHGFSVGVPHLVPQVVDGALLLDHGVQLLPVHITVLH